MTKLYMGDLVITISTKLSLDQNKAKDIANQLVSQLLAPVMEDIKQIQRQKFGDRAQTAPTTPVIPLPPSVSPQTTPQTSTPAGQSFHEQNMGQKDIMETGGNVLDLRNQ